MHFFPFFIDRCNKKYLFIVFVHLKFVFLNYGYFIDRIWENVDIGFINSFLFLLFVKKHWSVYVYRNIIFVLLQKY